MPLLCVIPARLGSTRLHHKPLCLLSGEPLVRVVAVRAVDARFADTIVVASDDTAVLDVVRDLPVDTCLTAARHGSGTERVAEVARRPEYGWADVVVNVQGDEPFFPREAAVGAAEAVHAGFPIGTAAGAMTPTARTDPNQVKVVVDRSGRAVAFSRAMPEPTPEDAVVLRHIGIYAYTPEALQAWVAAPPVPEEATARLEQLRPMRMGVPIGVTRLNEPAPPTVDTPEDLEAARHFMDRISVRAGR